MVEEQFSGSLISLCKLVVYNVTHVSFTSYSRLAAYKHEAVSIGHCWQYSVTSHWTFSPSQQHISASLSEVLQTVWLGHEPEMACNCVHWYVEHYLTLLSDEQWLRAGPRCVVWWAVAACRAEVCDVMSCGCVQGRGVWCDELWLCAGPWWS